MKHNLGNIKQNVGALSIFLATFKAFLSSLIFMVMHFLHECLWELTFHGQSTFMPQGVGHPWPWWPLTCWSSVGLLLNVQWQVVHVKTSLCVSWWANMLWFLAHLVMSLCNHALSGVWCCCWHCLCLCCLCTAVLVTALIIETSYPANICINTPSICTWNIMSMWCIFFKQQPF